MDTIAESAAVFGMEIHTDEEYKCIWRSMPYVVRLDFDGRTYLGRGELLNVASFH